jgi:hypothetical protein
MEQYYFRFTAGMRQNLLRQLHSLYRMMMMPILSRKQYFGIKYNAFGFKAYW